jgi:hypothetical protein
MAPEASYEAIIKAVFQTNPNSMLNHDHCVFNEV